MNNFMQLPVQFHAKASTEIKAKLYGPEKGLLILGTLFLIVFLASLISTTYKTNIWGQIGIIASLLGMIVLLIKWLCGEHHPELPQSSISVSGNDILIQTPTRNLSEIISLLREVFQNRKPLPAPHGEVIDGKPQDTGSLRVYTENDRNHISEKIQEEIRIHDQEILENLKKIEYSLEEKDISSTQELPVQSPKKND